MSLFRSSIGPIPPRRAPSALHHAILFSSFCENLAFSLSTINHPPSTPPFSSFGQNFYDENGVLLSTTNRAGETIQYYYDTLGRVTRQWGAATYPVAYEFNEYGEMVKMGTYRTPVTFTFTAADFAGASLTLWSYDPASGALMSKSSPLDQGPGASTVSYQYGASGQLIQRTGARGLVASYSHDLLGRLTDVAYPGSANTPPAHFSYYRNGELKTTTDVAGLHFYSPMLLRLRNTKAEGSTPAEVVTPANSTDLGSHEGVRGR